MVIPESENLSTGNPFTILAINIAYTSQVGNRAFGFHNQPDNFCYFAVNLNRIKVVQQLVIFTKIQMSPHNTPPLLSKPIDGCHHFSMLFPSRAF